MTTLCHECHQSIEADDPFCRYCGRSQSSQSSTTEPTQWRWSFKPTLLGLVISLVVTWCLIRWLHWPGLFLLGIIPFWWTRRGRQ